LSLLPIIFGKYNKIRSWEINPLLVGRFSINVKMNGNRNMEVVAMERKLVKVSRVRISIVETDMCMSVRNIEIS
jgi:hypothetical protein